MTAQSHPDTSLPADPELPGLGSPESGPEISFAAMHPASKQSSFTFLCLDTAATVSTPQQLPYQAEMGNSSEQGASPGGGRQEQQPGHACEGGCCQVPEISALLKREQRVRQSLRGSGRLDRSRGHRRGVLFGHQRPRRNRPSTDASEDGRRVGCQARQSSDEGAPREQVCEVGWLQGCCLTLIITMAVHSTEMLDVGDQSSCTQR